MSERGKGEPNRLGNVDILENLSKIYIQLLNRKTEELFHQSVFFSKYYAEKYEKI